MGVLYLMSPGSSAKKVGPRIVVEKNSEVVGRLPVRSLDGVVVGRNSDLTTNAVFELLDLKIPICYIDDFGKIAGILCNEKQSSARFFRQSEIFQKPEKQVEFSREIIREKIRNQRNLLKRYGKTSDKEKLDGIAKKLAHTLENLKNARTTDEIRGAEGNASKNYFGAFPLLIAQPGVNWKGRSQHPAKDPVNSLLNYAYAFLEREVRISAAIYGMDARIGFFHSNNGRKDSLIFDLMEFFRQPVADRFVLSLLNKKMIHPENFQKNSEDCKLNFEGRNIFCTRYEEYMSKEYKEYDGKNPREMINERVKKFSEYLSR